ncbi:MAG: replication-associated recombination protein A [Phycisphaerales bacterium]|nr:replication-associated recombination protein A [Phycisphaerales bacterium]
MQDLWSPLREQRRAYAAPLAVRMRPRSLAEFVGQKHCLGEGKLLRKLVESDALSSVILSGPPGTGKTTFAEIVAAHTKAAFERAHGARTGVKELREMIDAATQRLGENARRTILFVDEIHRLARNQRDTLLEGVEAGSVVLIGATTENPNWACGSALLSRSIVFRLEPLEEADLLALLQRALTHPLGVRVPSLQLDADAATHIARAADGDARRALSALEIAAAAVEGDAMPRITLELAIDALHSKIPVFDGTGDEHYDLASAFIKSMRGSDPDAAMYWLARMLTGGEDPRFIARRLAIFASEDVGNADPRALQLAIATWDAVERVGMPEAQLNLGQCVAFLACCPKSNASAQAIWTAMADAKEGRTIPVPMYLQDQTKRELTTTGADGTPLAAGVKDYVCPHAQADGVGTQEYLGVTKRYYEPVERGLEVQIAERLRAIRAARGIAP